MSADAACVQLRRSSVENQVSCEMSWMAGESTGQYVKLCLYFRWRFRGMSEIRPHEVCCGTVEGIG